jgi:hypothetical protein
LSAAHLFFLIAADLALDGIVMPPTPSDVGTRIARLKKGAKVALARLGLISLTSSPAQVSQAFVRFYETLNNPDELISGISTSLRAVRCLFFLPVLPFLFAFYLLTHARQLSQELASLGIDFRCPILVENVLCKAIRHLWGNMKDGAWLVGQLKDPAANVGLFRTSATGWDFVQE